MGIVHDDPPPVVPIPDPTAAAAWHAAADELATWAFSHLVVRGDRYGGYRLKEGTLGKQTKPPAGSKSHAFSKDVLRAHFRATTGEAVVGGHPLTAATDAAPSVGKWVGIDLDNHGALDQVADRNLRYALHLYRKAAGLGFQPLLCTWGTGGFHLWAFVDGKVPGPALFAFGNWLVADAADFGFYAPVEGDAASGWPESNPKQARVTNYGNWLRFPGRHHKLDVWPVVFDGAAWVQGAAAVGHVLTLARRPASLIPAAAAPDAAPAKLGKAPAKKPKPEPRVTAGPKLRVTGDTRDVFAEYNRAVALDDVVAWHEQLGRHEVTARSAHRIEFRRDGKGDGGNSFNVEVRDNVPVTFNFSTGAALPANDGLSPSEVRCFYETGRCDAAAMREFAKKLRAELGWETRAEPDRPAAAGSPARAGAAPPRASAAFTDSGYTVILGGTFHCQLVRHKETGEITVADQTKLANFAARIVGETVTDDGVERTREFRIEVEHQRRPPSAVTVPVEKFAGLDWVVEQLGPGHVIRAGRGIKDHLRCAIQELSGDDAPTTTAYAHTGWREVGGRWVYLHAGGAIGAPAGAVAVRLDGAAAGFHLPDPPTGDELRAAVRASLGLLDGLAPDAVTFPLVSAVYRAALGGTDFGLWLAGPTGAQKSELAALAQQHYGPTMTRTRLPGNWSSTENALEGLAFTAKDALLVVDDFAPPATRADLDRLYRTADRLIRGQGNSAGRQRMRADGTLRPQKPPRGLLLTSGEDVPRGHSITARLSVVAVARGCVNLARLSACQRDAADGRYAASLAGYLAWLAPQYTTVAAAVAAERIELRDRFLGLFPHARTPDIVANQLVGLRLALRFAEAVGAVTPAERAALWGRGQAAFRTVADFQGEHQRDADPVGRFPDQLASLVSSGDGHLATPDGNEPRSPMSPEAWGWEGREYRAGADETGVNWSARGRKLGWVGDGVLYLDPDSVYAGLVELARRQGQAYPLSQQTLFRRLKEAGAVVRAEGDRTTYPVTLEGARRRVVHVRVEFVFPTADPQSRFSCPGSPDTGRGPGQENDAKSPENRELFPTIPEIPVSWTGERAGTPDDEFTRYDAIAH